MEPPFIILRQTSWMSVDEEPNLLGGVVKNFWDPLANVVPSNPVIKHNNQRKLNEKSYNDFIVSQGSGSARDMEAKLQGLSGVRWRGSTEESIDLSGKLIRYRKLRSHDEFWKSLKTDPAVRSVVPEWVRSGNTVCVVVGIFICENVEVEATSEKESGSAAKAGVPLGTIPMAAGGRTIVGPNLAGPTSNTGAAATSSKQRARYFKAEDTEGSIFALQLKVVSSRWYDRQNIKMTEASPKAPPHRQMGGEGLPTMEDLILENKDPITWLEEQQKPPV